MFLVMTTIEERKRKKSESKKKKNPKELLAISLFKKWYSSRFFRET